MPICEIKMLLINMLSTKNRKIFLKTAKTQTKLARCPRWSDTQNDKI